MRMALVVVLVSAVMAAHPHSLQQGAVFTSRVDVVRIDALVTSGGRPVRGLRPADFEVRDNGVLQQVDYVALEDVPLNVVLAFDVSGSVAGDRIADLRRAGRAVFDALTPRDRGALVTFGAAVRPGAELTSDVGSLREALERGAPSGQTSLFDACFAGLMLGTSETGRSMLLTFSDGVDTASWLTAAGVIDAAKRADVVTYSVVPGAAPKASFLKDLATATGGELVTIKTTTDLHAVFLRMLDEHRLRYLVSYTPRGVAKGGWHRLDVRVKGRDAKVKARPGYEAGTSGTPRTPGQEGPQ
jgi:VWFA-related protein